jgi:hypothetical protein
MGCANRRKMQQQIIAFKHRVKNTFRKKGDFLYNTEKRESLTEKEKKSRTVDSLRVPPLAPARGAWLI